MKCKTNCFEQVGNKRLASFFLTENLYLLNLYGYNKKKIFPTIFKDYLFLQS